MVRIRIVMCKYQDIHNEYVILRLALWPEKDCEEIPF